MSSSNKKELKLPKRPDEASELPPIVYFMHQEDKEKMKQLIDKHMLQSYQAVMEAIIVGGIIYRDEFIIKFIEENYRKYKNAYGVYKIRSVKKTQEYVKDKILDEYFYMFPRKEDKKQIFFSLYANDRESFERYLIDCNKKRQWVLQSVIREGFCKEVTEIIDFVIRFVHKKKIPERKKQVSKINKKSEYITILSKEDSEEILRQLTKEYDSRKFESSLELEIESILNLEKASEEKAEDDSINEELNRKMSKLKNKRSKQKRSLMLPVKE